MIIGCCGWGFFKPKNFFGNDWRKQFKTTLQAYAKLFNAVEVNSTFYRMPRESTAEKWREQAREINSDFVFTVKAFKGITHEEKFGGKSLEYWEKVKDIAKILEAPIILIQTPKSFTQSPENVSKVEQFLEEVDYKVALELRGFEIGVVKGLCKKFDAIPAYDPFRTKPFGKSYFRLHGLGKRMYDYKFKDGDLKALLKWEKYADYIFFNNFSMYEDCLKYMAMRNEIEG